MRPFRQLILCAMLQLFAARSISAKSYRKMDTIPLYANKVGPFSNPTETYRYYSLPFCQPDEGARDKLEDLGEVLEGDRLVSTPYVIKFKTSVDSIDLCKKSLTTELKRLREAVAQDYYFQMYLDDLPVWGFIGKVEKVVKTGQRKYYLFTHFHFEISYNGDNVIEINVSSDPMRTIDITTGDSMEIKFSYSVTWKETPIEYEHRMDRYSRYSFLPQHLEIHWFSIINSVITVLLLTGFLATILLRVLKNDFLKYTRDHEAHPGEDSEEGGWKYLHGDVFRFPPYTNLLSAMIGVGTQMLVITLFIFSMALVGVFYPYNRGGLLSACVVLYAFTAIIAGYVGGRFYKMFGGTSWVSNVALCAVLFCGPVLCAFSYLNTVAILYRSTAALPFGTIVIIILLWALITFPLTVVGGMLAKNSKAEFSAPCRTTKLPRDIPPLPWYRTALPQMAMAGFLPFSAIYIELYYIFASIWGHKVYTIYSILFIVFIMLIIVTAFITVALTYFQLAVEDHRWWWRSFACGGSTGIFVFVYCFYYYYIRSDMSGLMQTSFFFGYNALVCYAFFLMLGSVGFRASLLFVRSIYRAIKCE